MIDLKERVSQFLRVRTLSNLLLVWGCARDDAVAVMSAALVGVLAIAIDLGRAYTLNTKLDNTADAYALAGATQLDKTPGSCVRAMEAAVAAVTTGINSLALTNTETVASNASGANVFIDRTLDPFNNPNTCFMERINQGV